MTVAPAVLNKVVQAIVWVHKSGLSIPGAFAFPWSGEGGRSAAAKQADPGNVDAPLAGGGSAG